MNNSIRIDKTFVRHTDCNNCEVYAKFNKNNKIKLSFGTIIKSDKIIDKNRNLIDNPLIGYCTIHHVYIIDTKSPFIKKPWMGKICPTEHRVLYPEVYFKMINI